MENLFNEKELEYLVCKMRINKCNPKDLPDCPLYLIGLRGLETILIRKDEGSEGFTLFSSRFPDRTNKFIKNNLSIGIAYNITHEMVHKEGADYPFLYSYWKNSTLKPIVRPNFNYLFEKFQSSTNKRSLETDVGWSDRYENAKESGLYVIYYKHGFKVGISKNIAKRIKSYDKPWNLVPIKYKFCTGNCTNMRNIEKDIKTRLKHLTIKGSTEFFYTSCVEESEDTIEAVLDAIKNKD